MLDEYEFNRITLDMKAKGAVLRSIREKKNIRIEAAASYLGTSVQSIYNWECGKTDLTLRHLIIICDLYETPIEYVVQMCKERAVHYNYDN